MSRNQGVLDEVARLLVNTSHEASLRRFSLMQAKEIGDKIKVDWNKVDLREFQKGLHVELEHGRVDAQTDVTHDDLVKTGKIALIHLKERPQYYTRLKRAGLSD